ncbi:hypothetical protein AB0M34_18520 [Nocardia sp. NPDC050193]
MTTEADHSWRELGRGEWPADVVVPQEPPSEQARASLGLPPTRRPIRAAGVRQTPVFDPAAQEYIAGVPRRSPVTGRLPRRPGAVPEWIRVHRVRGYECDADRVCAPEHPMMDCFSRLCPSSPL